VFGLIRLYGDTAVLAARRGARAWPVMFSLVLYAVIFMVTGQLAGSMGMIGGFVLGLVLAACFSSYIHLISQAVTGAKVRFADLRGSFGARFRDVISVLFAFWIINLVLTHIIAPAAGAKASIVTALFGLAMAVLFNPVPELLYQGSSRSFQLLMESGRFVSQHGLEWLLPNVLFAVVLLAPLGLLHGPAGLVVLNISALMSPDNNGMGLYGLFARAPLYLQLPMLVFVHFIMVYRGLLFAELTRGSGARQRALRGAWGR
jgi:hypothetical protein